MRIQGQLPAEAFVVRLDGNSMCPSHISCGLSWKHGCRRWEVMIINTVERSEHESLTAAAASVLTCPLHLCPQVVPGWVGVCRFCCFAVQQYCSTATAALPRPHNGNISQSWFITGRHQRVARVPSLTLALKSRQHIIHSWLFFILSNLHNPLFFIIEEMQEQTPSGFLFFFFFVSNFIQLGLIKHLRQRGTRLQVCNGWSLSLMWDLYFIKLCKACSPGGSDRQIFKWTDLFQITSVKLWTDYWINLSTKPWCRLYWETHETTHTHAHTQQW